MAESTVQSIEISAPAQLLFDVASDVERYPEWATGVKHTEVLERDEAGRARRARFVVEGMVKQLEYVLVYRYEAPHLMAWTAEPGDDIKLMEGSYEFRELEDEATEVVYALRAEIAFKIPGFLRRQVEKQIVGTALRGLRSRAEELAES
jgi:ribosome-associated toxin RatA of RatAB toxin-antitoxin module